MYQQSPSLHSRILIATLIFFGIVTLFLPAASKVSPTAQAAGSDKIETFQDSAELAAQAGNLDPSFNGSGKVTTDFLNTLDAANAMVVQSDGKIVVAGGNNPSLVIARYNTDGSLDPTFGSDGKVATQLVGGDCVTSLAMQPDGKIVAAFGYVFTSIAVSDFVLVRYNANGSLDTSFGLGGKLTTDFFGFYDQARSVAIQSDGKIIAAGSASTGNTANFAIARYGQDGALDTSFGSGGKVTTDFFGGNDLINSVRIQQDNKIVAAGRANSTSFDFALARYNGDGNLDITFGSGGKVTTDFAGRSDSANSVAIQPDGKIVAAGSADTGGNTFHDFAIARYDGNGSLDTSFGSGGKSTTDFLGKNDLANSLAIQSDGKMIAGGFAFNDTTFGDFALARYNLNGALDFSFGSGGKVRTSLGSSASAASVAIQTARFSPQGLATFSTALSTALSVTLPLFATAIAVDWMQASASAAR